MLLPASPQLLDHRRGQLDSVDAYTGCGQWQSESARADCELQRRSLLGQVCKAFDSRSLVTP